MNETINEKDIVSALLNKSSQATPTDAYHEQLKSRLHAMQPNRPSFLQSIMKLKMNRQTMIVASVATLLVVAAITGIIVTRTKNDQVAKNPENPNTAQVTTPTPTEMPLTTPLTTMSPTVTTQPTTVPSTKPSAIALTDYKSATLGISFKVPGNVQAGGTAIAKAGFTVKEKATLSINGKTSSLTLQTKSNPSKQTIQDWIKGQNIAGEQTTMTFGSFHGIVVDSTRKQANNPLLDWLFKPAHAASTTGLDFYCVNDGEILNISLAGETLDPTIADAFKNGISVFQRSPLPVLKNSYGTATYNNKLYIFGGFKYQGATGTKVRDVSVYDPELDLWENKADLPTELVNPKVVALNGRIYVTPDMLNDQGENLIPIYIYDIQSNSWTTHGVPTISIPAHFDGYSMAGYKDTLYIIGGKSYTPTPPESGVGSWTNVYTVSDRVYTFNTQSMVFGEGPRMGVARHRMQTAVVDGKIYAVNGEGLPVSNNPNIRGTYNPVQSVEVLDIASGNWKHLKDFPAQMGQNYLTEANGMLYLFGVKEFSKPTDTTMKPDSKISGYTYNTATDSWKEFNPGLSSYSVFSANGIQKSIYVQEYSSSNTILEEYRIK